MPDPGREAILGRLRGSASAEAAPSDFAVMDRKSFRAEERYPRLKRMMEAVKAEFLETTAADWPRSIHAFLAKEGLATLLYGPDTEAGAFLRQSWPTGQGPRLVPYDRPIEEMKREIFENVDAGFTATRGGIAETGGLILWPSPAEPRLLSLVPPVHLALLDTKQIHATFWHAVSSEGWAGRLPANALLVSGPSKTADIEQTLAYGVHGPKRLVVVVIDSQHTSGT